MYSIINKMAEEIDLSMEQADYAFSAVITQLLNKVPQLEQLIDSVFSDADSEKISHEVDKVMFLFQQQKNKNFIGWSMPELTMRIQDVKNDIL